MNRGVHLLAYADRFGGTISGLGRLLAQRLPEFTGVHILPFFIPFDGDDAGFDPRDHASVDPRLGGWADVRALRRQGVDVTADLIVNHVSASAVEFQDWLARGKQSPHDGMFLTFDRVLGTQATEETITAFYRPRPGHPFIAYVREDGSRCLVWTTFMGSQVDIDVKHPAGERYLRRIIAALADGGVKVVRVDAVGYAIKTPGSDSFMTEETLEFVAELTQWCHEANLEVLVEVHAHFSQQLAIAALVDWVYDFALAPLLLHSLLAGSSDKLAEWLQIRPSNAITVLDTHDGIGIIDAGPSDSLPGLIDAADMSRIFQAAAKNTHGLSARASVIPQWATMPHQINATFPSVCGDDTTYLLCRAVQMFIPGLPQIYYVGLLNGDNDIELFESTGHGRDVNRHRYAESEMLLELGQPAVRAIRALVQLRTKNPAFEGHFECAKEGGGGLRCTWSTLEAQLELVVDMSARRFRIEGVHDGEHFVAGEVSALAALGDIWEMATAQ